MSDVFIRHLRVQESYRYKCLIYFLPVFISTLWTAVVRRMEPKKLGMYAGYTFE